MTAIIRASSYQQHVIQGLEDNTVFVLKVMIPHSEIETDPEFAQAVTSIIGLSDVAQAQALKNFFSMLIDKYGPKET